MTNETSAGIIVYYKKEEPLHFLLLHYTEGHWDFPKGHVIVGEKLEETAMRETKEETGLTVNVNPEFKEQFTYFFKNREGVVITKTVHFYVGEAGSKEVEISNEHIGYIWMSYEHALKKLTFDNAKEVLKKAHEFLTQKRLKEF
jgi:bis(5'-nucleosidyl)-tetraphosphatase